MTATVASPVLSVPVGTYLTDGTRLVFVRHASRREVTLEVAGGLGPGYDPDANPVLLRQTWREFRDGEWRTVIRRAEG